VTGTRECSNEPFHKMRWNSLLADDLLAYHEELCSTELSRVGP